MVVEFKYGMMVQIKGHWKNDKANGKGKLSHTNGDIYEGKWEDDKVDGYGNILILMMLLILVFGKKINKKEKEKKFGLMVDYMKVIIKKE